MFAHSTPSCRLILASVVFATATSLNAQLASRSPFMPPQSAATNTPTQSAPLEFGGYLDSPSEGRLYRIMVKDPARKTTGAGAWVKLNEKNSELDVTIKQHDESQKPTTLTIEHQGKTLTLAERESKITSAGAALQMMPQPMPAVAPPPPQNVPPAVTQAVVLNPTPQDEQRRLEAVAAEVARRRALREQATQQIGGNPPPAQPQGQTPAQVQQMQQMQQQQQQLQQRGLPPGVPMPANMPQRGAIPNTRQPQQR
jgi:hypothetical protein